MPSQKELNQKVQNWLRLKLFNGIQVHSPEANVPPFPETISVQPKIVPKVSASISRLRCASSFGLSIPSLASLLSSMERPDAQKLYSYLSTVDFLPFFNEKTALNWFIACHNLQQSVMPKAVLGFLRIAELHQSKSMTITFQESLACWYKVLFSNQIQDSAFYNTPIKIAEIFPDRFAFACVKVLIGGNKIVDLTQIFLSDSKIQNLKTEESVQILDFILETGWLLNKEDFQQIWNLISNQGSKIQGRLTGGLVPMGSIRFLTGVFRGLEKTVGFDVLLKEERIKRAKSVFNSQSEPELEIAFSLYPDAVTVFDNQILLDITVEAISVRTSSTNQSDLGFSLIEFLKLMQTNVSFQGITDFLQTIDDNLTTEVLEFLSSLIQETSKKKRLSSRIFNIFVNTVTKIFPFSSTADRAWLKSFYRAIILLEKDLSGWAVKILADSINSNLTSFSSVLSASSLLLRASEESNKKQYLSRLMVTARLLDSLSITDREKALSGMVPLWVESLLSFNSAAEEKLIKYINKVQNLTNRNRYLENVITKLLFEVDLDDPVFEECLSFAVTGYNTTDSPEKLREIDHNVFAKVFRAGGRVAIVDNLMVDLLAISGIDDSKTEQMISGVRAISERFSRLVVWEDDGDSWFQEFISCGVSNIFRSFVDNPGSLDSINQQTINDLLSKLIPDSSNSINSLKMINPGGTAQIFFGSILPNSIALFDREPSKLIEFLYKVAEEFSRSVGGMTAGKDFAKYLVEKLNQEIKQDLVTVLSSWLSQQCSPSMQISDDWSIRKREEWNKFQIQEDTAIMKLHGAVTALTGSSSGQYRKNILDVVGFLYKQLGKTTILGSNNLSLEWNREKIKELLALTGDTPLISLFQEKKHTEFEKNELFSYLKSIDGFMQEDIYHAWRHVTLPPLLNCAMDIVFVSNNSKSFASKIAETATSAVEFLGYNSADGFLSTLSESLRYATSPENGFALIEKKFLLPLWKRNAAERLDLLVLGMEDSRLLSEILTERLLIENSVNDKVDFMKNYATFFITVEKALLSINSDFEKSKIADGLMDCWIFSGVNPSSDKPIQTLSLAVELVQDVFRRIKYGSGIVSASQAGEISSDMRKKYRDNADSVAIILRWTVDPAREGLLQLLEESQLLLQAAGTDAELMRLLDMHGTRLGFLQDAKPYSEKPAELKKYLKSLAVFDEPS